KKKEKITRMPHSFGVCGARSGAINGPVPFLFSFSFFWFIKEGCVRYRTLFSVGVQSAFSSKKVLCPLDQSMAGNGDRAPRRRGGGAILWNNKRAPGHRLPLSPSRMIDTTAPPLQRRHSHP